MCRKHLLGEHVELHMLLGSMRRGKNMDGFLSGGLVDPQLVFARHEELVTEMTRRGFKHTSSIDACECVSLAAQYAGRTSISIAANAAELQSFRSTFHKPVIYATWNWNETVEDALHHSGFQNFEEQAKALEYSRTVND